MGSVFVLKGQLEKAVGEARRATELAPDHPLAAGALADWLNRSGQKQAAVIACREAIRIRPAQKKPHLIMAAAQNDLGNLAEAEFHRQIAEGLKDE
jgi:predicted Zn-dependent protease